MARRESFKMWFRFHQGGRRKGLGNCYGSKFHMILKDAVVWFRKYRFKGWRVVLVTDRSDPPVIRQDSLKWGRFMQKRTAVGASGEGQPPKHRAPVETNILHQHMRIVEHCAVTQYDDGSPREPGWYTTKTTGSAWVLTFKEPDSKLQLIVHGPTLDDALALAELLLASNSAPWEQDKWADDRKSKKK